MMWEMKHTAQTTRADTAWAAEHAAQLHEHALAQRVAQALLLPHPPRLLGRYAWGQRGPVRPVRLPRPAGTRPAAAPTMHVPASAVHIAAMPAAAVDTVPQIAIRAKTNSSAPTAAPKQATTAAAPMAAAHEAPKPTTTNTPAEPASPALQAAQQRRQRLVWRHRVGELARFAVVFGACFALITIGLNAPAYKQAVAATLGWHSNSGAALLAATNGNTDATAPTGSLLAGMLGSQQEQGPVAIGALPPSIPGFYIIIPRLGISAPVHTPPAADAPAGASKFRVYDIFEKSMQQALEQGVAHYPSTANPGDSGNVVLTGHSSYDFWQKGAYKEIFAALHQLQAGDEIIIYYEGVRHRYIADAAQVVSPKQVEVLEPTTSEQLTLITCTPLGTNLKRLVITAKPV